MAENYLSTEEVAKRLKITNAEVVAAVQTGKLRGFKDGQNYKFRDEDVRKYQEDMKGLNSQRIVAHAYLPKAGAAAEEGEEAPAGYNDKVRMTQYEDGTRVYVNYSNVPYTTEDGVVIPAYGYQVERGSAK